MKHLYHRLVVCLCLLAAFGQTAMGQQTVTFHDTSTPFSDDFTIGNTSVSSRNTLSVSSAQNVSFSATLYRPNGLVNDGRVDIYLGDASGNLSSTPLALAPNTAYQNTKDSPWSSPNSSGIEAHQIAGSVQISPAIIASYTTLYAVFVNTNNQNSPFNEYKTTGGVPVSVPTSSPVITSLSPANGLTSRTYTLTITGTGLGGATAVSFNGTSLAPSASSATQVTVNISTPATAGQYPVTVTTPGGTSNSRPFTVASPATQPPTISLNPTSGPTGSTVAIAGAVDWGGYSAIQVNFGGVLLSGSALTISGTTMRVAVPQSLGLGTVSVTVSTSVGASNSQQFTVTAPPPFPITIFPAKGPVGTLVIVTQNSTSNPVVTGDNVTFASTSVPYLNKSVYTGNDVTARVPAGVPSGDIPVTMSASGKLSSPATFTVTAPTAANILSMGTYPDAYPQPKYQAGTRMQVKTDVEWSGYSLAGYSMPVVNFNGIAGTNVQYITSNDPKNTVYLLVTIPAGLPNGTVGVSITNQFGAGNTFNLQIYVPFATSLPCGTQTVVCGNQCVPAGVQPQLIHGRILADKNSSDFQAYVNECAQQQVASFARGEELEQVQWQLSYDQNGWYNLPQANQQNYQPGAYQQTTYFRRVSTHIEGSLGHRADWYTSEVVTITAAAGQPVPVQYSYAYSSCGAGAGTVALAVQYDNNATGHTWRVPYSGWSFNSSGSSGVLNIPAGVAIGTYPIYVSATGACGQPSSEVEIDIVVNRDPPGTPANAYYVRNNPSSECDYTYDLAMPLVAGASSYHAVVDGTPVDGAIDPSSGSVYFYLNIYGGGYSTATVTASNNCGDTSYTFPTAYLDQSSPSCGYTAAYPNPVNDQLTLSAGGKEAEATLYDAQGTVRQVIKLHAQQVHTVVNTLALPAGTYHLRIVTNGKPTLDKQIVVQH